MLAYAVILSEAKDPSILPAAPTLSRRMEPETQSCHPLSSVAIDTIAALHNNKTITNHN